MGKAFMALNTRSYEASEKQDLKTVFPIDFYPRRTLTRILTAVCAKYHVGVDLSIFLRPLKLNFQMETVFWIY